jgi:hypothetical protein
VLITELMAPLLGDWQGAEQQEASPWAPASGARAALRFKHEAGGSVVVQDYRQVREDGMEFYGHGVFLAQGEEVWWWFFDSYGEPPVPAVGGWVDGELALVKTTVRGTAVHRFRPAWDTLEYRITLGAPAEGAVTPFLAGTYTRISGH